MRKRLSGHANNNGAYQIDFKIKQKGKSLLVRHNSLLRVYSLITKHRLTFAANYLDLLIDKLLPKPGFYVELGANDGISQSQTKFLEVYCGWRGVLIEPTPEIYRMLRKNRSSTNYFENSACVSFDFPNQEMPMLYSDLMTISLEGQNDIINRQLHAQEGVKHLLRGVENYEYMAPATTLNQILMSSDAPSVIDLLSLDVEGSELEVLQGIEFNRYKFRLIFIETRSIQEVEHFLNVKGYSLLGQVSKLDFVFSSSSQFQQRNQKIMLEEFLEDQTKNSSR